MYCKNCGNENTNKNINIIYNLLSQIGFINVIIMVFYTLYKDAGSLGVLAAIIVGPLFMGPQAILTLMSFFKKKKFILNMIFIFIGLISTVIFLSMINYKFNIFIILNIVWLITMLIILLISNNKLMVKK